MSSRRNSLSPPDRTGTMDPGAHELVETSDSEDHFSDAQSAPQESHCNSPIPKTRVEKVDDEPSYGEVPGTQAYKMREGDAAPDEIAVIPDNTNTDGTLKSPVDEPSRGRSRSPGGHPIPRTVVEESPDTPDAVEHAEVKEKHRADAPPDLVIQADGTTVEEGGDQDGTTDAPISPALRTPSSARIRRKSSARNLQKSPLSPGLRPSSAFGDDEDGDGDDFGDDFDDFEEGGEDGDFGEFDDGFQQPEVEAAPVESAAQQPAPPAPTPAAPPPPSLSFSILDFDELDADDILAATEPYLNALFPPQDDDTSDSKTPPHLSNKDNHIFLTPRSASLWSQLVAPPPLQPPDWIRSRIRRLFLVSLGVPVDLDEILPATKQKKLVLPSLHLGSPRNSTDSRSRSLTRLKREQTNASNSSVDSQGKPKPASRKEKRPESGSRRRGGPSQPDFDLAAAKQLCTATDEALGGMTDAELQGHVARLGELEETAKQVLDYWTKRTDEKLGDREAFEGVIENLVKHARKVRK